MGRSASLVIPMPRNGKGKVLLAPLSPAFSVSSLPLLLLFPFLSSYLVVVLIRSFHEKELHGRVGFLPGESVESTERSNGP